MKKKFTGIVTSDKMNKSRRVEIDRKFRHPKYGKFVRGRTVCHVHDESNTSRQGDLVEIVECRPRSKTKRWELVQVVQSAGAVPLETVVEPEAPLEPPGERAEPAEPTTEQTATE